MVRINRLFTLVMLAALIFSACQPIQAPTPSTAPAAAKGYTPRYEPAECKYPIPEGEQVACGYLTVPEDRSKPDGPTIRLHVVNFKSKSATPKPDPIFVVHGGPGASGAIIAALWTSDPVGPAMRAERDNIYLEYRGSNFSEPAFYCPEMEAAVADLVGMSFVEEVTWSATAIRTCHDRLVRAGQHLAAYNVLEAAADFADLRTALGLDEVNLYGVSYGTLVAMTMMRDHPQGLRSVVLDSIIPPEVSVINEGLQGAYSAFTALFRACANDTTCNSAYPKLESTFYALAAHLRENPVETTVEDEAGQSYTVTIDDVQFVNYVWNGLWSHNIAAMPADIYNASLGNYRPIAQAWLSYVGGRHGESKPGSWANAQGLWYGMQCLHDGSIASIEKTTAIYHKIGGNPSVLDFIVATWITDTVAACAYWDAKPPEPNPALAPFTSTIPTLLVVGSFDPNTPPYLSQPYIDRFNNGHYFELPVGHVSLFSSCGSSLFPAFIADPTQAPVASCIDEMKIAWVLPE
ncbi:MAG: alpha/beta fold hydrolase [Caldilinea sp. CFX5]|nr:alpha/beta fold hydrolase [Caldilinea sp. CFX5]